MLKNIIIISVVLLLVATASNISVIDAQVPADRKLTGLSVVEKPKPVQTETDEYHRSVNERFVIETLKSLYDAEADYILLYGGGNFGTLQSLRVAGLIDEALATGEKYGYQFSLVSRNANVGVPSGFYIRANPRHYGRTGNRSFYMDAQCKIKGVDNGGYDAEYGDPVIDTCSPYLAFQIEYDMTLGMRQLQVAQKAYRTGAGNGSYGSFDDLVNAGLIEYLPAYNWFTWLTIRTTAPTKTSPAKFRIYGTPQVYRETAIRSFFADETGVLRGADLRGALADENTPPLTFTDEDRIKYALRSLWKAQRLYRGYEYYGMGYYSVNFEELFKLGLIDTEFQGDTYAGYRFEMVVDNNEEQPWFRFFEIKAVPVVYGKTTRRSFYIHDYKMLRGADKGGKPADSNDPVIEF